MDGALIKSKQIEARYEEWGSLSWSVSKMLTGSDMTVGRVVIKRGMSNPKHSHPNCEEALFLIKGKLLHLVGEETVEVNPGDTLVVSVGVPHQATSIGEEDAEMIVVFSSGDRQFRLEE